MKRNLCRKVVYVTAEWLEFNTRSVTGEILSLPALGSSGGINDVLFLMRAMSQPAHLCGAEQYIWRMQCYFDNMDVSSFSSLFNKDWERAKRMEERWRAEQSPVPACVNPDVDAGRG